MWAAKGTRQVRLARLQPLFAPRHKSRLLFVKNKKGLGILTANTVDTGEHYWPCRKLRDEVHPSTPVRLLIHE